MIRMILCIGLLLSLGLSASAGPHRVVRPCPLPTIPSPVPAAPAKRMPYADEPVKLQLKFAKGQDFYVEIATQTKQMMKVMGQDVLQNQEQIFVWHCQPVEQTPDGAWRIRTRAVAFRMNIDIGGNRTEYDSAQRSPPTPLTQIFDAILKTDFQTTVQADGTFRIAKGKEEFMKMLEGGSPASPHKSLMETMVSDESRRQMFAPLVEFLPKQPVAPGDRWTSSRTLDFGPIGRYIHDSRYTYQGNVGPLHEIRLDTSLTVRGPKKGEESGLPFTIKSVNMESTQGTGKILFDADKGRLHELTQSMGMTGTIVIEVGSTETRVDLEQTQTVRIRTMETYTPTKGAKR
jgi:Family of unknown function (DUF6263)